uniref:Cysteine-rich motor neuron 1 protein n=1 Tax=Periophthalmus magnuspinnatus TaxID=409849 RepID=A0A3B4B6R0_9GOBI
MAGLRSKEAVFGLRAGQLGRSNRMCTGTCGVYCLKISCYLFVVSDALRCSDVTCPPLAASNCPSDSVLTRSFTPPAGCCPAIAPQCTCDFSTCHKPLCPTGQRPERTSQASGQPGDCCDVYECQKGNSTMHRGGYFGCFKKGATNQQMCEVCTTGPVPCEIPLHEFGFICLTKATPTLRLKPPFCYLLITPKCMHNGKEFAEGDVYRMDPCWLCQCRGGISFCSKAECAELDCENFYIPEGECCPVCIGKLNNTMASCWVNNKLRTHEEKWKEDDCTFCQCVDGEPHCTAMACKQSCQNPVKIPGECCPFCEEPSYETVSPLLCPPLENCTLSGTECPYGFLTDENGCLLCQCLSSKFTSYCSLQCPMGYERDDFGCEVCECHIPVPKCRPLSCTKTCPYGYVRNKHGCEMCRCVKCPPFTCDKHCPEGYRQNKKGCSICMCKVAVTTATVPMPSFCLTSNGHRYEEGDSWHDGCRDCYCHSGREMCVLISCPVPSCPNPVVRPDQCCPTCEGKFRETTQRHHQAKVQVRSVERRICTQKECISVQAHESGSGQAEGMDMVVCRAPGGEFYVEGETWDLDECTRCTCRRGRVLCDTEQCPPALCHSPRRNKDTCCHVCPDEPHLGENFPSQAEMALIYQSAAWILAGLLLAIIIFIIVALLINRKKKWVQMSCYSAPKKVVSTKNTYAIVRQQIYESTIKVLLYMGAFYI